MRRVVTSFLRRADGKILLLKRSTKVSTFHEHWAGCSGSLESEDADLLSRALTEIKEETNLDLQDVRLIRQGRALVAVGERRKFHVTPFLFQVQDETLPKLRLDWEHTALLWTSPYSFNEVAPMVPRLEEAFHAVWFPDEIEAQISSLQENVTDGASTLALAALDCMVDFASHCDSSYPAFKPSCLTNIFSLLSYQLATARPSMVAIANSVSRGFAAVEAMLAGSEPNMKAIGEELLSLRKEEEKAFSATVDRAVECLVAKSASLPGLRVLTTSYSSTVLSVLKRAARAIPKMTVVVTESRPGMEGVALARALAADGIPATVITEAQAALFVEESDVVVLGADSVFPDGSIVNKVGSHMIALAAKAASVPVYAVSSSSKLRLEPSEELPLVLEERETEEVLKGGISQRVADAAPAPSENLDARNIYFERIPGELLAGVLSEKGLLTRETCLPLAARLHAALKHILTPVEE